MISVVSGALSSAVSPAANFGVLRDLTSVILRNRALAVELNKRDLGSQFAGQILGSLWIVGHPLMLFAVYVFIFGIVLKVRIPEAADMPRDYITYILAGLVPWLATQQTLARAPVVLMSQASLVKQVVFPIEVLPVGAVVQAAVPLLIGLVVVLGRSLFVLGDLPWTVILLPVAIAIHAALLLGIAYLLAAITPFVRDVKDIVNVLSMVGVYIVPAFYLPQWVPGLLRPWLYLNPFSYIIWMYQDCIYYGSIEHPAAWGVSILLALFSLALGARVFRKLKPFVANVL